MKNTLLILFLAVSILSCEKDESRMEIEQPSVTGVTFEKAVTGTTTRVKLNISLSIPGEGSLKRVDALRGTVRIPGIISVPKEGVNSFYDNGGEWPTGLFYYSIILVLKDDTEILSGPYQVKL